MNFNKNSNLIYDALSETYSIVISDTPDFLFYSCFGNEHEKYNNCVKIFCTAECVIPNFNECDYAISFDDIKFGNRHLQYNMFYQPINDKSNISKELLNRRFCNFIYSNACMGEGAILRQEFFHKLSKYKHIDAPGKVCHNMDTDELEPRGGDWMQSKQDFLGKYKFTIAFENSISYGYTTEKFFNPMSANSIPIYYGNPDIIKDFNSKAFINCNDYDNNLDKVIERVIELDNDDKKYLEMLNQPKEKITSRFKNQSEELKQFLIKIIEKGNKPFNKDPVNINKNTRSVNIVTCSKNTFLQKIFSVENNYSTNKKYKVITILGIKFKFKIKDKVQTLAAV